MSSAIDPVLDALSVSFTRVRCSAWDSEIFARRITNGVHFVIDLSYAEFRETLVFPSVGIRYDDIERKYRAIINGVRPFTLECNLAEFGGKWPVRVTLKNGSASAARILAAAETAYQVIASLAANRTEIQRASYFETMNLLSRCFLQIEDLGFIMPETRSMLCNSNPYERALLEFLEGRGFEGES